MYTFFKIEYTINVRQTNSKESVKYEIQCD